MIRFFFPKINKSSYYHLQSIFGAREAGNWYTRHKIVLKNFQHSVGHIQKKDDLANGEEISVVRFRKDFPENYCTIFTIDRNLRILWLPIAWFQTVKVQVRVCKLWDQQLLIHIVRKSTPRFTRFTSLVLIRLVFTEIQRFKNVKIYKEMYMYGIRTPSRTASGLPYISL